MSNFSSKSLQIPDVLVIAPRKFQDSRGFFMETYSEATFREFGIACNFVQDNQSYSGRPGTVRGLHFQLPPAAQAKLVRVIRGAIFDVAVDLRRESASFGKWCGTTLSADSGEQIFIPCGFAHGFCTLEPDTEVVYKVDSPFALALDAGLRWNDSRLSIAWPTVAAEPIVSEKDANLPVFADFVSPF